MGRISNLNVGGNYADTLPDKREKLDLSELGLEMDILIDADNNSKDESTSKTNNEIKKSSAEKKENIEKKTEKKKTSIPLTLELSDIPPRKLTKKRTKEEILADEKKGIKKLKKAKNFSVILWEKNETALEELEKVLEKEYGSLVPRNVIINQILRNYFKTFNR